MITPGRLRRSAPLPPKKLLHGAFLSVYADGDGAIGEWAADGQAVGRFGTPDPDGRPTPGHGLGGGPGKGRVAAGCPYGSDPRPTLPGEGAVDPSRQGRRARTGRFRSGSTRAAAARVADLPGDPCRRLVIRATLRVGPRRPIGRGARRKALWTGAVTAGSRTRVRPADRNVSPGRPPPCGTRRWRRRHRRSSCSSPPGRRCRPTR